MTPTALLLDSFDAPPELNTAVSAATLKAVASGELPDLFRIHVPARVVAFGRQDTHTTGFNRAVAACRSEGFTPVIRLAGGRAAVFHEGTLAFSWQTRTDQPKLGVSERFEFMTSILVAALASLGYHSNVGEVPGEYCPGRYSVHIGQKKIAGVGQRLVSGAAHVGGVLAVTDGAAINRVLTPVYEAMEFAWDPNVTGAVGDFGTVTPSMVSDAVAAQLGERVNLTETSLPAYLVREAAGLVPDHRPQAG